MNLFDPHVHLVLCLDDCCFLKNICYNMEQHKYTTEELVLIDDAIILLKRLAVRPDQKERMQQNVRF